MYVSDLEIKMRNWVKMLQVTDGRRAEVEFTKDWKLDANREGDQKDFIYLFLPTVLIHTQCNVKLY